MRKDEIIQILDDWNFWNRDQRIGLSRPIYTSRLEYLFSSNQVITITGPRRAGKSFVMRQMIKKLINNGQNPKDIMHVNLEDPRFTESGVLFLEKIFQAYREYISPQNTPILFLDEIQEIEGFEKWIRMMHELSKAKIIISGSNASLLSRELGTLLTGRHIDMEVFPLSFGEFLSFNNIAFTNKLDLIGREWEIKGALRKYIEYGSFPEVTLSEQKKEILLSYFEDAITKDLLRRYKIKKAQDMRSIAKYYLSNIAALSTFKSIERALDMSITSVKSYTGYLEQAYLVFPLKRFSFKVREQEKSPRKIYAIDTGLCNAVGFRFSENDGRLAENVVFMALKRQQNLNPNMELFYWKDVHHREVDFVVKEGLEIKSLIQVCWNMHNEKTRNREMRSLAKAMKELNVTKTMIITDETEGEEKLHDNKVKLIPLWKWLLTEEGLLPAEEFNRN
ncbi:MAG: ATP-binding protein [Candidatus Aureabacteria bacterium]|nr:ATP-binding protein [Candidatus Auribacterota bacterium]